MMKVMFCGVCHTAENFKVDETPEKTKLTCERCGGVVEIKQLTWQVSNMLNPETWTEQKGE